MPASGPETRGLGLAGPPLSPPRSASSWPSVPGDGPGGGGRYRVESWCVPSME